MPLFLSKSTKASLDYIKRIILLIFAANITTLPASVCMASYMAVPCQG